MASYGSWSRQETRTARVFSFGRLLARFSAATGGGSLACSAAAACTACVDTAEHMTTTRAISVPDPSSGDRIESARSHELNLPVRHPRPRRIVALLIVLALVAGWQAIGASAQSVDDLRGDIPTGDAVRDELAEIADTRLAALVNSPRQSPTWPTWSASGKASIWSNAALPPRSRLQPTICAARRPKRSSPAEMSVRWSTSPPQGVGLLLAAVSRPVTRRVVAGGQSAQALRLRAGDAVLATIDQAESPRNDWRSSFRSSRSPTEKMN